MVSAGIRDAEDDLALQQEKQKKPPFLLFYKEKRGLIATLVLFSIALSGIKMVLSHHLQGSFCTCDAQKACVFKGFRTSPKPSKLIPTRGPRESSICDSWLFTAGKAVFSSVSPEWFSLAGKVYSECTQRIIRLPHVIYTLQSHSNALADTKRPSITALLYSYSLAQ